ncbi:MAG: TIR domain-containing protein [Halanaerobiales bacterium]
MAHDVFISYSTRDKHVADAVCNALEYNKIRCWIAPRDIHIS